MDKNTLNESFVATLDFSFLQTKEFPDVSSKIMKAINKNVEKAYKSLVDLRDNISAWVEKKDYIAADQVYRNKEDLNVAINGIKEEIEPTEPVPLSSPSEITEKNNKLNEKILDNLIKEVILTK